MNPTITPELKDGDWRWPDVFDERIWRELVTLDMDVLDADAVRLIRQLCDAWLRDAIPNQPLRAGHDLKAEVGHDTYSAAGRALRVWL